MGTNASVQNPLIPDRLVFSNSIEALLIRGIGHRITPSLEAELASLGINLKKLPPAIATETWQRAVEVVARALYPELTMGQAQRKLGESTVYGFEQTMFGKAVIALSKVIGPRRVLQRFPQTSRSSNNFSIMIAKELSPTEFEMTAHPYDGAPEFIIGCLHAVVDITGGKDPKVELIEHDPKTEKIVLRVKWSE